MNGKTAKNKARACVDPLGDQRIFSRYCYARLIFEGTMAGNPAKTENLTEEAKRLLYPIKQRPNLEPNKDFVNELHQRITMEKMRKGFGKFRFCLFNKHLAF